MSNEIITVLQALARSEEARPVSARLRDYIEEIDMAVKAGVRPEAIEKALTDFGIELSPTALRGALYRYRKKRKALVNTSASSNMPISDKAEDKLNVLSHEPTDSSGKQTVTNNQKPGAYKSDLTVEEKEFLKQLTPSEKIEFFRQRESQMKFTHNPTPERFREKGE
jgi:hypothetical protein